MTPEITAALYGGISGGVLAMLGVLVGVFLERQLQWRGKVRCVVSDWDLSFQHAGELTQATCSFEVDLFNEQPLATGLRDVRVVFIKDDGQEIVGRLRDVLLREGVTVNLPPREWVHASLHGRFDDREARKLENFRRAEFVGYLPDGRAFRQRIVGRKDFMARRKRLFPGRKDYHSGSLWRGPSGDED
ncbi:hypothetical protein BH18ACT10_BH18ACT10_15030 [soil metagenome]|nr:hypothetical protein [Rubrobacter sp.]